MSKIFLFLNLIYDNFFYWFFWLNLYNENWVIQFFICYLLYIFYNSKNIFMSLIYLFFIILFFGFFLSLIQMELFTGFLWVAEFTVIFILLILFFHLNVEGSNFQIYFKINYFYYYIILSNFLFFFFFWFFNFNFENSVLDNFNNFEVYDNYYEAFNNYLMNDFTLLKISYYEINSLEFISVGLLLLFGSVVCVVLNKNKTKIKNFFISDYLHFFKNYYFFLRKQNPITQSNFLPSIRIFKKSK